MALQPARAQGCGDRAGSSLPSVAPPGRAPAAAGTTFSETPLEPAPSVPTVPPLRALLATLLAPPLTDVVLPAAAGPLPLAGVAPPTTGLGGTDCAAASASGTAEGPDCTVLYASAPVRGTVGVADVA